LDLSRRRVDVCLVSSEGELVEHFRAPADRDGLLLTDSQDGDGGVTLDGDGIVGNDRTT
jgi:hypothetical protein